MAEAAFKRIKTEFVGQIRLDSSEHLILDFSDDIKLRIYEALGYVISLEYK